MKTMKIGLVCPYNILKGGGVQEHVLALQAELQNMGHQVKIITPLPRDTDVIDMPNIIFVGGSTDLRSPTHTTVQISATADMTKLDDMLAAEAFDILNFHEPWVPMLSRQILQRSASVNIATFHAKLPETQMSRTVARVFTPYLKSVMNYFQELTAVSSSAAEYASGLTDRTIAIIPDGINLKTYHPTTKTHHNEIKMILYIGRLERRKGVKYLLNAYKVLAEQRTDVRLVIAGDGPDREKLELLAEDLKLEGVSFLGYISDDRKLELLAEADLFCSPALYGESFGIVLLEAMASRLVTVAGSNSGYIDVMQGSGAISIVNPRDEDEFARRLQLLLFDEPLRSLWQQWAAANVGQYSYKQVVAKYQSLYRKALKQHGA